MNAKDADSALKNQAIFVGMLNEADEMSDEGYGWAQDGRLALVDADGPDDAVEEGQASESDTDGRDVELELGHDDCHLPYRRDEVRGARGMRGISKRDAA
jgi:hypothetical protein